MTESAAPAPNRPSFEFRAQVVLGISIALLVLVSALVAQSGALESLDAAVRFIGVALILASLVATWIGLGRKATWATGAAVPILLLTILFGVADVAIGLAQSRFTVPVAAIAAWWALRAYRPAGGDGQATAWGGALLVAGFFVVGWSWGLVADRLLVDGGPLRAGREDLVRSLVLDCGTTSDVPATAAVAVTWSWARGEPFGESIDHLAIAWRPGPESRSLFIFERFDVHGDPTITLGSYGVAGGRADDWVQSIGAGVTMTVEPSRSRYAPRSVTVQLARPEAIQLAEGSLDVQARYFHDGRWDSGVIFDPGGGCNW